MSEVTQVDKHTYSVTNSAGARWLTWVELKNQTLQRADEYCQSINSKLVKPKITSNSATGLTPKRATVTFRMRRRRAQGQRQREDAAVSRRRSRV